LFGVRPVNLTAVAGFRLDMLQRSRATAQLSPKTAVTPGMFGFLLRDAAKAIHFGPGQGLKSGLRSAISLTRCMAARQETALEDADSLRHDGYGDAANIGIRAGPRARW
jgi:2-polyprenyl-6-methoxyphenol hydroxylase-like FAD-dependent oxidoreductase